MRRGDLCSSQSRYGICSRCPRRRARGRAPRPPRPRPSDLLHRAVHLLIFPLPADFYEYEMCESFGLTCYPDYVGPDAPRVLSEGGPYFMIETDWRGESAPPISRTPYADDCVPDEEFAARFADLTLYTLHRCR